MRKTSTAESAAFSPGNPADSRSTARWLWIGVAAVFAGVLMAYVLVFRVAHAAQIRDVPLAVKGAKP